MAQTLVLGLGGTGSRAVNNLAKILNANGRKINSTKDMCCAVFDTNKNDNGKIIKSGTEIPVIPTSRPQKIADYIEQYRHLNITEWCPESPEYLEESMIDGASEIRTKSRIAFLDTIESDTINELEIMINRVLDSNLTSKIRIMVVSSLAGGTGSGMFIQVALWLRKFFSRSQITIRGIFLLPDVFINTIEDIRENKTTQVRHYCNAYAAIRELNTITKIMKSGSVDLTEKIQIGDLFDSDRDANKGKSVYDYAFFVDYQDSNGISLPEIGDYEEMLAQLVYMQMYAPMKDDMYSEEDNAFLSFVSNEEPLYGSCGTSKAVYPANSVATYCHLKAIRDSLSDNWKRIDNEISALEDKRKREEEYGNFSNEVLDFNSEYIKFFDRKTSADRENSGKDGFFRSIANDVTYTRTVTGPDDKVYAKHEDKIKIFLNRIKNDKIKETISKSGGLGEYYYDDTREKTFIDDERSKEDLLTLISNTDNALTETINTFDGNVKNFASDIIDEIIPYSMGEINMNNIHSVYSLFTSRDLKGNVSFIHPVAARYLLYKLQDVTEKEIARISYDKRRTDAVSGPDKSRFFDNKDTSKTESSAKELIESKKWYQREDVIIDKCEKCYVKYINEQLTLCEMYFNERLMHEVFTIMNQRVTQLINQIDSFFARLDKVIEKTESDLEKNINEIKNTASKTEYICGDKKYKECIYNSLKLDIDRSNPEINKALINSIYGCFCAAERPKDPNNKDYCNIDICASFYSESIKYFKNKIENESGNKDEVYMDIYTAVCRQFDIDNSTSDENSRITLGNVNVSDGSLEEDDSLSSKHEKAFRYLTDVLHKKAAPFLIYDKEPSKDFTGAVTMREKTFWGYHPDVNNAYSNLGAVLGINADLQASDGYLKNELYCYRAVYGIEAKYIPKFNELNNGKYFTSYTAIIEDMVKDAAGKAGESAYIRTPHLDKRWHKLLPYVTPEKHKENELAFYKGFWLAVAYNTLRTDKNGIVYLKKTTDDGYGGEIEEEVPLMHDGEELTKTDTILITDVLKNDAMFNSHTIPALFEEFKSELKKVNTYVGTKVIQGLTTAKDDLNPIDFVCRYYDSLDNNIEAAALFIGGLNSIARDLAEHYNVNRSDELINEAKTRILKKIYDSSTRIKGKSEIFKSWENAFKNIK